MKADLVIRNGIVVDGTGADQMRADVVVSGTQSSEGLGQSLAFLGDTNGDGYGDYALGA